MNRCVNSKCNEKPKYRPPHMPHSSSVLIEGQLMWKWRNVMKQWNGQWKIEIEIEKRTKKKDYWRPVVNDRRRLWKPLTVLTSHWRPIAVIITDQLNDYYWLIIPKKWLINGVVQCWKWLKIPRKHWKRRRSEEEWWTTGYWLVFQAGNDGRWPVIKQCMTLDYNTVETNDTRLLWRKL